MNASNNRYTIFVSSILLLAVIVIALFVTSFKNTSEPQITHARLGKFDLYIPKDYAKFYSSIGTESALLVAWYPGSAIPPGRDSTELWRQGVWWKHITVLINSQVHPTRSFHDVALMTTDHLKANKVVGDEYGLTHKTQGPDGISDSYDVWYEMEAETIVSFITCTEKIIKADVPQCKHYFQVNPGLGIQLSYNKKLLPEWKVIKGNASEMIDSFQSYETAKRYAVSQMSKETNDK